MASFAAVFSDGTSSERHQVTLDVAPVALRIHGADGAILARWPYDELQHLSAADDVLRLRRINSRTLARLEVRDPALASAIDDLAGTMTPAGAPPPQASAGRSPPPFRCCWSRCSDSALVERLRP